MNINPYQSPQAAEQASAPASGDSASIVQLLIEIRDAQHELLRIQRDTLARQRRTLPFALLLIFLAPLSVPLSLQFIRRPAPIIVPPARTIVPPQVTPPLPTASLLNHDLAAKDH